MNDKIKTYKVDLELDICPNAIDKITKIDALIDSLFNVAISGSMGTPIDYVVDYNRLSVRSRQIYLENDIAQTVMDRFTLWIVGKGLKMQSQPIGELIGMGSDKLESVKTQIELQFHLWAKSRISSHNGESSLNWLSNEAFKNAKISGDCLVIIRYNKKKKNIDVQLIDGQFVCGSTMETKPTEGNTVDNGVELNSKNEVVAYHVHKSDGSFQRIKAIEPQTGLRQAFLIHANKYRIESVRGLPAIATTMETLKKIDRYKEATVGSAEERQKIAFQIVHQLNSDGSSPFTEGLAQSLNADSADVAQYPNYSDGASTAQFVTATTDKTTVNMPVGSELKQLESKNELYFKDFYQTNADIICASIGIPPNVAFSLYNDSYSASRASIKDWEHTMVVQREKFQFEFLQPIYEFWLHVNTVLNRIDLVGYWDTYLKNDLMKLEAFRQSRFFGQMPPHIDPIKEVEAQRRKLGDLAKDIPLTTIEEATEQLSGGDAKTNMAKFSKELDEAKKLKLTEENDNQSN
jgi:capsid protein